jgi:hypothetical protein
MVDFCYDVRSALPLASEMERNVCHFVEETEQNC